MTNTRTPTSTHVERPERVEPADLDRWLGQGYFRMRQSMFSTRFVLFEGVLRTAVWTRLPLDGFVFRGGLLRRLRANQRRFRVTIRPFVPDAAHEAVYAAYRAVARGERSETVIDMLRNEGDEDVFHTRVLDVWDGDRLAAFSLFDEGWESVQSIAGVYDPEYASRSLGIFTLCQEILHAQATGKRYHYAGYVLPGVPAMDYKHAVGELEGWDADERRWMPFAERMGAGLEADHMVRALVTAQDALRQAGVDALLHSYPEFEGPAWSPELAACLDQPMYLALPSRDSGVRTLITWDVANRCYELCKVLSAVGTFVPKGRPQRSVQLWLVRSRRPVEGGAEALAAAVTSRA
ncbi:MAG TPA: hypothetical protein PKA64_11740 [Myxococcota bacterium]|nr:hypothetical protein [Myxococcota bacterium]